MVLICHRYVTFAILNAIALCKMAVSSVKCAAFHDTYFAIKAAVKPRTREKDPVSGSRFYYPCIIITTVNIDARSCILSAYCTCKGGIDGCCRHMLATLYEVIDFGDDQGKQSITSGPCVWVRRANDSQNVTLLTDIVTSAKKAEDSVIRPAQEVYQPVPAGAATMDVDAFFEAIKQNLPETCLLHTWEKRPKQRPFHTPPLTIEPIGCQLKFYMEKQRCSNPAHDDCPCSENFLNHIHWSPNDQGLIEVETRGQHMNKNWHTMRYGLLTASNIKTILHSPDRLKPATKLLKGTSLTEDEELLPPSVKFGRQNEQRALRMFFRSHRYLHRNCTDRQLGLMVSLDEPFLVASPDAIGNCKHRNCGQFLVEVKCLFSDRNFHPKAALKKRNFCGKKDGTVVFNKKHKYYYQLQCQMAVTGIHRKYLCAYTRKGVEAIEVTFDSEFWGSVLIRLRAFYKEVIFPLMCK